MPSIAATSARRMLSSRSLMTAEKGSLSSKVVFYLRGLLRHLSRLGARLSRRRWSGWIALFGLCFFAQLFIQHYLGGLLHRRLPLVEPVPPPPTVLVDGIVPHHVVPGGSGIWKWWPFRIFMRKSRPKFLCSLPITEYNLDCHLLQLPRMDPYRALQLKGKGRRLSSAESTCSYEQKSAPDFSFGSERLPQVNFGTHLDYSTRRSLDMVDTTPLADAERERLRKAKGTRVLCMVLSTGQAADALEILIGVWGWKCTGLITLSNVTDPRFGAMQVPTPGGDRYVNLSEKMRSAFKYVWYNYADSFDWFFKLDDDTLVLYDNLLRYLVSDEVQTLRKSGRGAFLGYLIAPQQKSNWQPFFSGGAGYLMDRAALEKLAASMDMPMNVPSANFSWQGEFMDAEDVYVALCLHSMGVLPHNTLDGSGHSRFHHLWISQRGWNPNCCSKQTATFHYLRGTDMLAVHHYLHQCQRPTTKPFRSTMMGGQYYRQPHGAHALNQTAWRASLRNHSSAVHRQVLPEKSAAVNAGHTSGVSHSKLEQRLLLLLKNGVSTERLVLRLQAAGFQNPEEFVDRLISRMPASPPPAKLSTQARIGHLDDPITSAVEIGSIEQRQATPPQPERTINPLIDPRLWILKLLEQGYQPVDIAAKLATLGLLKPSTALDEVIQIHDKVLEQAGSNYTGADKEGSMDSPIDGLGGQSRPGQAAENRDRTVGNERTAAKTTSRKSSQSDTGMPVTGDALGVVQHKSRASTITMIHSAARHGNSSQDSRARAVPWIRHGKPQGGQHSGNSSAGSDMLPDVSVRSGATKAVVTKPPADDGKPMNKAPPQGPGTNSSSDVSRSSQSQPRNATRASTGILSQAGDKLPANKARNIGGLRQEAYSSLKVDNAVRMNETGTLLGSRRHNRTANHTNMDPTSSGHSANSVVGRRDPAAVRSHDEAGAAAAATTGNVVRAMHTGMQNSTTSIRDEGTVQEAFNQVPSLPYKGQHRDHWDGHNVTHLS